MSQNRFAHLIPSSNPESPVADEVAAPETPSQKNRFAHLIPGNDAGQQAAPIAPAETPAAPIAPEAASGQKMKDDLPAVFKLGMDVIAGAKGNPLTQTKTNLENAYQGVKEIGQGAKQSLLGGAEYVGLKPYGTQAEYTRQKEEQHKQFEETAAGKSALGKHVKELVKEAPFLAATAIPMLGEANILMKMLMGGTGGALTKNLEYAKPTEDRAIKTAKGFGEGALLNLLPEVPELAGKAYDIYKGSRAALGADISGMQAAQDVAANQYEQSLLEQNKKIEASLVNDQPELRAGMEQAQAEYEASQRKQMALKTQLIEGSPEATARLEALQAEKAAEAERKRQLEASVTEDNPELVKALEQAQAEHAANLGEQAQAKSAAKQSPLKKQDTDIMQADLAATQAKLANLDQQLANQENLVNPAQYFVDTPAEAAARAAKAEETHAAATKTVNDLKAQEGKVDSVIKPEVAKQDEAIANAEKEVGTYLETGAEHDTRAAKRVRTKLNANKEDIQENGYKQVKSNLEEKNVTIPSTEKKTADELNEEIKKLVAANPKEPNSPEVKELMKRIDAMGKTEVIPANDYIDMIQSVNGNMREAFKKGYEPGRLREEQLHWQGVGRQLEAVKEKMEALLEKSIGAEDFALYKKTSSRWKNEVAPLYDNKVYWQIQDGKMPADITDALRGDTAGDILIKDAIKSDPQTLKHVVGQKYDTPSGRKLVYNPDEQMRGYTDLMPELQQLTGKRQAAEAGKADVLARGEVQKAEIAKARQEAEAVQARAAKHVNMQEESKATADAMRKEYNTKLTNIKDIQQQKSSLENTKQLLEKHITDLKASANKLKESEQRVAAAQKAINTERQQKIQQLEKSKQQLADISNQMQQAKGEISLHKRTVGKKYEEEKVSGKLIEQRIKEINRQIKAIQDKQAKELRQAATDTKLAKLQHEKITEQTMRAQQKRAEVISKLKIIGAIIGTAVIGAGGMKAVKIAKTAASLPGEQ